MKGLALAGALVSELQAFRVQLTAKGRDTYAAHSAGHDDLVLAVALAVCSVIWRKAMRHSAYAANIRFGSQADIELGWLYVRSWG